MTYEIFKFELRYHLKQPLFYILTLVAFLLTFLVMATDGVQLAGAVGNVNRNSPYVIMFMMMLMSYFSVLTSTAFAANAVHRDVELNTASLFFTAPLRKRDYLAGRFLGSFVVGTLVFGGVILAILISGVMPWVDKERIGAFMPAPYIFSFFVLVLPSLFLFSAIFFSVAALTRSLMATYASVVAFFVASGVSRSLLSERANEKIATLLDPFGFRAFALATRYWTVFERNHSVLKLDGTLLGNHLLWTGVALVILAVTYNRFDFSAVSGRGKKKKSEELPAAEAAFTPLPTVEQTFGGTASFHQYLHATKIESISVLKSVAFIIIMLLGMADTLAAALNAERTFDTTVYPITRAMAAAVTGGFSLFALVILAFYAGDIVWRERTLRLSDVTDATPAPTWVLWAAKLTSLLVILYSSLAAATLIGLIVQTFKGFHHYQLGLYFKDVAIVSASFLLLLGILAFFAQVITNNKYVGFMIMLGYFVFAPILTALHFEHNLYTFGSRPNHTYSDMNGYGQYVGGLFWFTFYWTLFSGILIVIAHLMWQRGTETSYRIRLAQARARLGKPAFAALSVLLIGFVVTGGYIYYNTNILNHYVTGDQSEQRRANYEKKFKKYERIPQPRITDVQADVDIIPERRSIAIRGTYTLQNKTAAPISDLHVVLDADLTRRNVTIPGATVASDDKELGYTVYHLQKPLVPGASMPLRFEVALEQRGFRNEREGTAVVANGTFINNFEFFPHLGYISGVELQDRQKRRKYGLAPAAGMKKPSDMQARMNNLISRESDWINLDTTVSTSPDQIALAPGYLQREWSANGRRYFRYKTTAPILGFWAYLSARYTVKRDRWNDVPIEIYYDAKHPYNVDRMIYAIKKSLAYYSTNFSPYQHKQIRIVEFPRYAAFAQSFPNTIPFSEGIGFIADLRDKGAIDYVFYVTAHEVAHQWWAHQLIGGDVQGVTMLDETLAQYSALMVMEHEYGADKMHKFLRHELDRYLGGRGAELVAEQPLDLVENQQYIHYGKGSLVMYALKDYIGEANVNRALHDFLQKHAYSQPPYPTALELVDEFRKVTPPDRQQMITDLFDRITLYDNRATEAKSEKLPNGKYKVTMTVEAKKLYATGGGAEQPAKLDDWIDVGVLGDGGQSKTKDDKVLFLEKRHMTAPKMTIEVIVNEAPTRAGIDPLNKLIDRNPDDNTKKL
jgi:ABC-2 type transport system permease protein